MRFERSTVVRCGREAGDVEMNGMDRRNRDAFPERVRVKEIAVVGSLQPVRSGRDTALGAWQIEVVSASTGVDGSIAHELSHPVMTAPAPRTAMRTI
jgi:hypothetical protein